MQQHRGRPRIRTIASIVLCVFAAGSLSACDVNDNDDVVIDGATEASSLAEEHAVRVLGDLRMSIRSTLNSGGIDGVTAVSTTRWDSWFTAQAVETFMPSSDAFGTVYDFTVEGEHFSALGALRVGASSKGLINLEAAEAEIVVCFAVTGSYEGVDFSEQQCPALVDTWFTGRLESNEIVSIAELDLPLNDRTFIQRTPIPSPSPRPGACYGADCAGG